MGKISIGKRSEQISNINSIFRLIGNNEDALTYALGYTFYTNTDFLIQFLKNIEVLQIIKGKNYNQLFSNVKIFLQESRDKVIGGRKDITIEFMNYRIVIEAKVDGSVPSENQLMKYTLTTNDKGKIDDKFIQEEWSAFDHRFIIPLTRRVIPKDFFQNIQNQINNNLSPKINIIPIQWGDIIYTIKQFKNSKDKNIRELLLFIEKDYIMKYYEHEVLCRHLKKDEGYKMAIAEPTGFYFDGSQRNDFVYPECLFFCPVTGPGLSSIRTGKVLRNINKYQILSADAIIKSGGDMAEYFLDVHCKNHPLDKNKDQIHIFELINSIEIPEKNQRFSGSASFYKDISDLLSIEK